MTINVFYSWQSDTEAKFNRSFIEDCIKKAIKKCKTESKINFEIALDRDTKGKIGSPDISNEIFKKIANSQIVIGDVTIVNSAAEGIKPTSNPNVLIETGFAVGKLDWEKIILICNEAYGKREKLPFDLRNRRIIGYELTQGLDIKKVKESLIQTLEVNISSIINSPDIFNLHFITKLYQFLNNKLFDLKNELFGFIDTVYSTAKIQKPESISADEFKAICNTIDVYAPLISKAKGNTYTKKYPNWHAYFESFSNNCRVILKEFYTFANHLDIEFLGLLSQIDSLIYSNFQRWSLRYVDDRGKSTVGPYAFYHFFAAAFCKEANEYFSAKYGSLQRKAMDNFRGITTKHKTLKLL